MTRSRAAFAAACVLGGGAALAAWEVAASAIYCNLIGRPEAFTAPWAQWLIVAPHWRANWFITLAVVASAVGPLLPFVAVAAIVYRCKAGRSGRQALYGNSSWASRRDLARNGISTDRRAF
jgi:hypothetical protein